MSEHNKLESQARDVKALNKVLGAYSAGYIVRACNSHKDLLDACEDAKAAIYDAMHAGNLSRSYCDCVVGKIEAAIEKAETT